MIDGSYEVNSWLSGEEGEEGDGFRESEGRSVEGMEEEVDGWSTGIGGVVLMLSEGMEETTNSGFES